jgi:NAD(P)-dependent dehydrogenase (short-subunit alcohol dehydrogenase family)
MGDNWTAERIPDQSGRIAVVTGANSGLGLITARELARAGARVALACRNTDKGDEAQRRISEEVPDAETKVFALDLASLDSVRAFALDFSKSHPALDLLINNAGLMAPPRRTTKEGFELQFGTNHLGHFALTGLLLGMLEGRTGARVVTVSSTAHRMGRIDFDDLHGERGYSRWRAYGQSKLANLMFALELDRRLRAAGSTVSSLVAHPGYCSTNLQSAAPPVLDRAVMMVSNLVLAQDAEVGALSLLYAATEPGLEGGTFVGPDGRGEHRGYPQPYAVPANAALDLDAAARLWAVSEEATGVHFDLPEPAATRD